MSQTETLLLVVLGFAVASLIALFVGRFAWNMALRLGAKRMQRQVPSTVAELHSERDRLRAEYAMLSQNLGARLQSIKAKMAEQMAEVTRHRNRLEIMMMDLSNREAEIVNWRDRVTGLEYDIEQHKAAETSLQGEIASLRAELGHRDQKISALDSELLMAAIREKEAQERLRQRIAELTALSGQIAANRERLAAAEPDTEPQSEIEPPPQATPDDHLAAADRETLDLQRELARLDRTWSEKLSELDKNRETGGNNIIALGGRTRQQQ